MKDIEYSKIKSGLYAACEDGSIISKTTKKPMKTALDKDGYVCLSLRNSGTSYSKFGVHRLLMIAFNPVEGMERLEVNHKDGNKLNNSLDNLEWVTTQENLTHARETGLNKTINSNTITEAQAKDIVNMLMFGYTTSEIIDKYPMTSKGLISKIRTKTTWGHLTKELVFPAPLNTKTYSRGQIEKTCVLISEGKDSNEIMDLVFGKREQKYRQFISEIKNKKSHRVLSDIYF